MKNNIYKYSRQREALYNLLASKNTHPTAAILYYELRQDFPHISQGTVYRNLNILIEQKRIKMINIGEDFAHFDADMREHGHIICTTCRKVEDLCVSFNMRQERDAEILSGYKVKNYQLYFYGICPKCQTSVST